MKVEEAVAVLHKIKVKEEAKACCGFQQSPSVSSSSVPTTAATTVISTTSVSPISAVSTAGKSIATASTIVDVTAEPCETSIIAAVTVNPTASTTPVSPAPSNVVVSPASCPIPQSSSFICQASAPNSLATMVNKSSEPFPVDLDLKTKVPQVLPNGPSPSREKSSRDDASEDQTASRDSRSSPCAVNKTKGHQRQVNGTTQSESSAAGQYGSAGASGTESPVSSHSIKPENDDSPSSRQQDESQNAKNESNGASISNGARCVSGIFAAHGKLKRLLGTLVQFATNISHDTGDSVRTLVLGLLSGAMTAEEFHSALQEATNFPLRGFVLPYLRHTLPSLRKDLVAAARVNNQTCVQYLRLNESAILESMSLTQSAESVDPFGDHGNVNGTTGATNYGIVRSNSGAAVGAIQHTSGSNAGSLHQHYSSAPTNLATKRRASDTPYYENGGALDDGPIYGKRSSNPWNHHAHNHQQQQQLGDPYSWYQPLHASGNSIQAHSQNHSHGPSPLPPGLVQVNQLTSYGSSQLPHQQQQQLSHPIGQTQNGSSLDDEWKNIHVMLNCILGMVEKTKRALAILQRRGSPSPAANASPLTPGSAVGGQNSNGNGNPSSSNGGSPVESSTGGDRDAGNLKRLSGEIVAQTIRATEDRVAEVKRRAEEAVQEVKRAAVAEVQRAVAVAVAESRANERLRVHRLLDLPLPHRSHAALRQSSYIRVAAHINPNNPEAAVRTGGSTPSTTSLSGTSAACDDEKDIGHMANVVGSGCWNCGRAALETCGGCGIARYCGSFCQHRDWEAGGHHATCNNSASRERPRRSTSPSPPRTGTAASNPNDIESNGASTTTSTK